MATPDKGEPSQDFPIREIQEERQRLELERQRLIATRDKLYHTVVEVGDDTGFALTRVLKQLKQVEQRIEQWDNLLRLKGLMS